MLYILEYNRSVIIYIHTHTNKIYIYKECEIILISSENITGNGDINDKCPKMRLLQKSESSRNINSTEDSDLY